MKIRNQNGVSLLEVLISMVILSISLLMLLNMGMIALDSNNWSNNATIATQLMQQKMEQLRNSSATPSGSETVDGVLLTWTVTDVNTDLKRVDISTAWHDISSRAVTNQVTTFIKVD